MKRYLLTPAAKADLVEIYIYSFLIVYRPSTRPLQVIRVLRGARDVRRILERLP